MNRYPANIEARGRDATTYQTASMIPGTGKADGDTGLPVANTPASFSKLTIP